jgi:uncharacterized protein with PIN domain
MPSATFLFHTDLNDFLPKDKRQADIKVDFNGHETVKHIIESLGVPHTEVDAILVNGVSVGFAHQPVQGDQIDVYPTRALEGIVRTHLQPEIPDEPRFVLDGHLGKLASYLRLLGFDTLYRNNYGDEELAKISNCENRILLTRDRGLLKRNLVSYGYCVRGKRAQKQVVEILRRYKLVDFTRPFSRCARCNGLLKQVSKADVYDRLEPKTKLYYDDFRKCEACDQVYWKGSHFQRMEKDVRNLLEVAAK